MTATRRTLGVLIGVFGFIYAFYIGITVMFSAIIEIIEALKMTPINQSQIWAGFGMMVVAAIAYTLIAFSALAVGALVFGWNKCRNRVGIIRASRKSAARKSARHPIVRRN